MGDIRDGELVGLGQGSNGRSCTEHEVCGVQAMVGTIFKIKLCVLMVNGNPEEALKAVALFKDGEVYMEGCTIGFLPRAMVTGFKDKYLNKTCVILEMYMDNDSKHKRRMDNRCMGACSFRFREPVVTLMNE